MEFHGTFADCDKNQNGVLELPEFKEFWAKNSTNAKRRFGESIKHADAEIEAWFAAYNMINKNKEGVSLADFKVGEYVIGIIGKMMSIDYAKEKFDPLVDSMMTRFKRFKPETKYKMKDIMQADKFNQDLFMEIMMEFMTTFKECDANKDGKLVRSEFKNFMNRNNDNMKKRIGSDTKGDSTEDDKWYDAYNMLNPNYEGVKMEDFKTAQDIIMDLMVKKFFTVLAMKAMMRMTRYKPETKAKIAEYMRAEEENPALFAEMMTEFKNTWTACDKNKDGLLNLDEFKDFANKHNENMKKRWGESTKGDAEEDMHWYNAYFWLSNSPNGISLADFKKGRKMLMEIIKNFTLMKTFTPLVTLTMMQMRTFSPAVQMKYRDFIRAEENDMKLFAEGMKEMVETFMSCDVN